MARSIVLGVAKGVLRKAQRKIGADYADYATSG
jgi:hypothetical protein